jgi:hypothetical protein
MWMRAMAYCTVALPVMPRMCQAGAAVQASSSSFTPTSINF